MGRRRKNSLFLKQQQQQQSNSIHRLSIYQTIELEASSIQINEAQRNVENKSTNKLPMFVVSLCFRYWNGKLIDYIILIYTNMYIPWMRALYTLFTFHARCSHDDCSSSHNFKYKRYTADIPNATYIAGKHATLS